eukprot:JP448348.1.p1 GENE.JP448348.1~~JP448348.1.p1  ORF type:complete len:151 (+),score=44.47 JP448348.1:30-455(+)
MAVTVMPEQAGADQAKKWVLSLSMMCVLGLFAVVALVAGGGDADTEELQGASARHMENLLATYNKNQALASPQGVSAAVKEAVTAVNSKIANSPQVKKLSAEISKEIESSVAEAVQSVEKKAAAKAVTKKETVAADEKLYV